MKRFPRSSGHLLQPAGHRPARSARREQVPAPPGEGQVICAVRVQQTGTWTLHQGRARAPVLNDRNARLAEKGLQRARFARQVESPRKHHGQGP
eukprot:7970709-Alexandrium_andersonii.AAC.1